MSSIFSSRRAVEALAALDQRKDGLRLTEVAAALAVPLSSAQAALSVLVDERLVTVDGAPRRRYRLAATEQDDVSKILDVAARHMPREPLLVAALRASPAVEFAGRDPQGLLLVIRWDAEPRDEVRLNSMLQRVAADLAIERLSHDETRERLLGGSSLRERAVRIPVIVGSIDRSFPDLFRHGSPDAPLLGDIHPSLRRPSRNALARIARRFGLSELRVFGSAVHADFRPDSDVDVLVRRRPGVHRTLESETSLRRQLEDLLERDVDLVDATVLRAEIRHRAESEGVVLYG